MRRVLTTAFVNGAKPVPGKQIEHPDANVPGLALRVSPAGNKSWTVRYRTRDGEQRRLTLGRHPTLGLSKARELAAQAIGDAAGGADPAKAKRASRAAAKTRKLSTVSGLIESYFTDAEVGRHRPNGRAKRASTMSGERHVYGLYIKPALGSVSLTELSRHTVQRFIDGVAEKAPTPARFCRDVLRQALNYGIRREIVTANPAQLSQLPVARSRERVLTDLELRAVWLAAVNPAGIDSLELGPGTGLALCLAMLTLQRGGEIVGIHARELDRSSRLWTIPGDRVKNYRTHVVPLSGAAIEILDRAFALAAVARKGSSGGPWEGYAFPSPKPSAATDAKTPSEQPISRSAFSKAMRKLRQAVKIEDATAHDFRRTGATNLTGERVGIPRFIVSRVLNQISDTGGAAAVTGVYDRNEYLAEKRKALDAWAALLGEIVAGKERGDNVVGMRRA